MSQARRPETTEPPIILFRPVQKRLDDILDPMIMHDADSKVARGKLLLDPKQLTRIKAC